MSSSLKLQLILTTIDKSILDNILNSIPLELLFIIFIDYNTEIYAKNINVRYMKNAFSYSQRNFPEIYFPGWKKLPVDLYLLDILGTVHINWDEYNNDYMETVRNQRPFHSKVGICTRRYRLVRCVKLATMLADNSEVYSYISKYSGRYDSNYARYEGRYGINESPSVFAELMSEFKCNIVDMNDRIEMYRHNINIEE
jgi:hypothetical protein